MIQRCFFISLLCLFFYDSAFSQPTIIGQLVAGGTLSDELKATCLTKDGGWIEGGHSLSKISGDKTGDRRGGWDYWVVKYNKAGKIQWDKTIGGKGTDFLAAIQQTRDGGYIVGGQSDSDTSGDKTENSRGFADYWIVKLDNKGNVQWDKTYGGSDVDALTSLQQTTDGGYILGGVSSSKISGEKSENSRGLADYWVIKTDSAGNKQWDKTIGGGNNDILNTVIQNKNGDYILNGSSESNASGEKTENNKCNCSGTTITGDYWIVKLNSHGKKVWDKTIGGDEDEGLNNIASTYDGGYIIAGASKSNISGDKTENSKGYYDYWIVKLNAQGNIQWDKTIGGDNQDGNDAVRINQTSDKGFIMVSGSNSEMSGDKTENIRCNCTDEGAYDYWVVKTDSVGNIQWDKTIGGAQYEDADVALEVSAGVYLITGYSSSNLSGDKTVGRIGQEDYWSVLLKYKNHSLTVSGITSNALPSSTDNASFRIYPNPVKNVLYVRNTGNATITITSQSGKTLLKKNITGNTQLNAAGIVPGLYYLKNNTSGTVIKFTITR